VLLPQPIVLLLQMDSIAMLINPTPGALEEVLIKCIVQLELLAIAELMLLARLLALLLVNLDLILPALLNLSAKTDSILLEIKDISVIPLELDSTNASEILTVLTEPVQDLLT